MIKRVVGKLFPRVIIQNSTLFDAAWYQDAYHIESKKAAAHYLKTGCQQGFNPSPLFSGRDYWEAYPDVAPMNPLLHYELYGKAERRPIVFNQPAPVAIPAPASPSYKQVKSFTRMDVKTMFDVLAVRGAEVYGSEYIDDGKVVFLFSHELNLTGAPIALERLALSLRDTCGYSPVILSPRNGALLHELLRERIPTVVYNNLPIEDYLDGFFSLANLVVVNTVTHESIRIIKKLNGSNTPVLWWVHESRLSYSSQIRKMLPERLFDNIHIYCAGWYARKVLSSHRPDYQSDILLYGMPAQTLPPIEEEGAKKRFAIVGTLEPRKGHRVIFEAIKALPDSVRENCVFSFAGAKSSNSDVFERMQEMVEEYPDSVKYLGVLSTAEMDQFYQSVDCLICCSLDDPMPIVVTEAWQRGIPAICSQDIGQAKLIAEYGCGILYENNDYKLLAARIEEFVSGAFDYDAMTTAALKVFKDYFSIDTFNENVRKIAFAITEEDNSVFEKTVSVIIPTYNGGEDIQNLIPMLLEQKNVHTEIICIDSGSTDGTVEYLKSKCKLIQIPQESFSHSYARNLAASEASGDYLLFMTQDVLPESDTWLRHFVQRVDSIGAVAASCKQNPRKEHDLYGKYELWGFNNFCKLGEQDFYTVIAPEDYASWECFRSKANLSDTCCLIQREVFERFRYRGNYAEDLDMGCRLLKSNYTLAYICSAPVIHSHQRPQYYIFKRSIVDYSELVKIADRNQSPVQAHKQNQKSFVDMLLTFYAVVDCLLANLSTRLSKVYDKTSFIKAMEELLDESCKKTASFKFDDLISIFGCKSDAFEKEIYGVFRDLLFERHADFQYDSSLIPALRDVFVSSLPEYYEQNGIILSPSIAEDLLGFIPKYVSSFAGNIMVQEYLQVGSDASKVMTDTVKKILQNSGV